MFFQPFSCGNSACMHTYIHCTRGSLLNRPAQDRLCFVSKTDSFFIRQTLFVYKTDSFVFMRHSFLCLVAARAGLLNHPVHHAAPCPENQHLLFVFLIFHAAGPPRLDVHAHVQKYMYACIQTYTCTHWLTLPRPSTARACKITARVQQPTANILFFSLVATRLQRGWKKKKQMHTCQKGPKLSGKSVY